MGIRRLKKDYDSYCKAYDSNGDIKAKKEIVIDKIKKLEERIDHIFNEGKSLLSSSVKEKVDTLYRELDILYRELEGLRKQTFEDFLDVWLEYNSDQ